MGLNDECVYFYFPCCCIRDSGGKVRKGFFFFLVLKLNGLFVLVFFALAKIHQPRFFSVQYRSFRNNTMNFCFTTPTYHHPEFNTESFAISISMTEVCKDL